YLSVIDGSTNTVVGTISTSSPFASVYSPVDHKLYVTNYWPGTLTQIDPTTDTVVATIPLGQINTVPCICPNHIVVNSFNGMIYVGGSKNVVSSTRDLIYVINPATHSIVTTIPISF